MKKTILIQNIILMVILPEKCSDDFNNSTELFRKIKSSGMKL